MKRDRKYIYVVLWLFAAVIATVATVAVIPDNPEPEGALFECAVFMTAGLLFVPCLRTLSGRLEDALRIEHLLMVGLVYWLLLDLLDSAYGLPHLGPEQVAMSFIAIAIFGGGVWVGTLGSARTPKVLRRAAEYRISERGLLMAVALSFPLGMFYFAYSSGFNPGTMLSGLEASRFAAPWSRGSTGGADALLQHSEYFGYFLPSLTVLLADRRGWLRWPVWLSGLLSLIFLLFLMQSGSRRVVGVVIGSALVSWLLLQPRIRMRNWAVIGAGIIVILALLQFMLTYRGVGIDTWIEGVAVRQAGYLHVDDNFLRLAQIIFYFPEYHPYVEFQPVFQALVRPIPRILWPDKPLDPGYLLSAIVGRNDATITQSIVGELYACYGLIAVALGGFVFGRIGSIFNGILTTQSGSGRAMIFGLGALALFASLRSLSEVLIWFYALAAWLVVVRLLRWLFPPRRRRRESAPAFMRVTSGSNPST